MFIPLLAAHAWYDMAAVAAACLAFVAMCLAASSSYLTNDLLDIEADRCHPMKRARPIASGALSSPVAAVTALVFVLVALGISLLSSPGLAAAVSGYLVVTLAYSLWLKKQLMLDVIALAGLYTGRILVGAVATSIPPSFWLLAFSMFLFLSLAMVKRYSELATLSDPSARAASCRGYIVDDLDTLASLGGSSGFLSVLVLALYINSDNVRIYYGRPELIWLLCPLLLYWLGRVWLITRRGRMHHDPVTFALTDPGSLWVALLSGACLLFAL